MSDAEMTPRDFASPYFAMPADLRVAAGCCQFSVDFLSNTMSNSCKKFRPTMPVSLRV